MKVVKKTTIAGNVLLQMEDWSKDYPSIHHGADQLAAYPVARYSHYVTSAGYAYPKKGERFRLGMYFPNAEAAEQAYCDLESGVKKLRDFVQFYDTTPTTTAEDFLSCL